MAVKKPKGSAMDGILKAHFEAKPYIRHLTSKERLRLKDMMLRFTKEVEFAGFQGHAPTDEEIERVALSGSIMGVNRPEWIFPPVKRVVLSSVKFNIRGHAVEADHLAGFADGRAKEIWLYAPILSTSFERLEGYHAPIHEFAHILDSYRAPEWPDRDCIDGIPPASSPKLSARCYRLIAEANAALKMGRLVSIDPYGARDFAETFACAVEAFFEVPVPLRESLPRLYEALSELFLQDPARGLMP